MTRCLPVLVIWCAILPQLSVQDTPEKLYRRMEEKIHKAKALRVTITVDAEIPAGKLKRSGELILATGNRVSLDVKWKLDNQPESRVSFRSDGKQTNRPMVDAGKMTAHIRNSLKGPGIDYALLSEAFEVWDNSATFEATEFADLGKEKVNDQEARLVGYKLSGKQDELKCKVWIDSKTGLPLKRTFEEARRGNQRAIEHYTKWEIDPVLSDLTFQLPK